MLTFYNHLHFSIGKAEKFKTLRTEGRHESLTFPTRFCVFLDYQFY